MFLKHIGRHNDRKVAVIFKTIPGTDHMCLVIYPDTLPAHWHDCIMKVLESDVGQQAEELADALHRNLLPDGRNILETLHRERMMKKVNTEQVIMTPTTGSTIRLDELNKILAEMKMGDEARKRLAAEDANRGLVDAPTKRAAESAYKAGRELGAPPPPTSQASTTSYLNDNDLADNMLVQAKRMEAEAKGLIAEAARMKKEAERMNPKANPKAVVHESTAPVSTAAVKTRGRPKKVTAAHEAQ
jgi:hypothetical protein